MTAFLADGTSAALVWIVAGIGVAALIAAVAVSLSSRRARKMAPAVRPARENGFTVEATKPSRVPAPAHFEAETGSPETAERTEEPVAEGAPPEAASEPGWSQPPTTPPPPAPEWMALWAAPRSEAADEPRSEGGEPRNGTAVGPARAGAQEPPGGGLPGPPPVTPLPSVNGDVNLRGILRWLLFETDADATVFHQSTPAGEQFYIEPRGLPDESIADLARRAREAMVAAGSGERAAGDASSTRWLGVGGSKLLLLTGASPDHAGEPLRFARFALEWLAASRSGVKPPASEDLARTVPGVAWAEMMSDGRLRVLPTEQEGEGLTSEALARILPGQLLRWIIAPPQDAEKRARLLEVNLSEMEGAPSAEVRLSWEGSELRGVGRGHTSLVGRHLAAARAAIDALKPLVHGVMNVEHLQVSTLPSEVEVVMVSVLIDEERLVGATVVRPEDEARAGAKAVLDAVNRRLVMIAGQSGQI